jgi:hypothetical protein
VSWRLIAIFIAIVRLLRKLALSTEVQRSFACSLRSIARTEGLGLSEGFRRSIASFTEIDRLERMFFFFFFIKLTKED